MNYDHVVFRASTSASTSAPPAGYSFELWTPSAFRTIPDATPKRTYEVWWLFHRMHVFRNRDYAVVLARKGGRVAHRLALFPGYFRFPFMSTRDLQIGDVWTEPADRGRGLAAHGLTYAMERSALPGRAFWYLTHDTNVASTRTAERAGMQRIGVAARTKRFGVRLFGHFAVREG